MFWGPLLLECFLRANAQLHENPFTAYVLTLPFGMVFLSFFLSMSSLTCRCSLLSLSLHRFFHCRHYNNFGTVCCAFPAKQLITW